jgi:hypothetical protein
MKHHVSTRQAAAPLAADIRKTGTGYFLKQQTFSFTIRRRLVASLVSFLTLLSFLLTLASSAAMAQDESSKITLRKGFLKPLRYQVGSVKPASVYDFTGLSFNPGFEKVISQNPLAHSEAKKAQAYNGAALVGSLAMLGITAKMFLGTLSQASSVNQGQMTESSIKTSDLLLLGASALVSIVASNLGHSHLKKGVEIYNGNPGTSTSTPVDTRAVPSGYPMPAPINQRSERIGVRIGLNLANISGKGISGTSSKSGLLAGLYFKKSLSDIVSIQPEAAIVSKGYKLSQSYYGYEFTYTLGLTYLEFPILARVDLGNSSLRPRLLAGPTFGFLLSSNSTLNGIKTELATKSFETGLTLGAGINLGSSPVSLDARYNIGLSAVNKSTEEYSQSPSMKNTSFTFALGYAF